MSEPIQDLLQRRAIAIFRQYSPLVRSVLERAEIYFHRSGDDGDLSSTLPERVLTIEVASREDGSFLWEKYELLAQSASFLFPYATSIYNELLNVANAER